MKKSITIATFITSYEKKNENFFSVVEFLSEDFDTEYFVFSDNGIIRNGNPLENQELCKTKFKRIEKSLKLAKNDIILCIDNDTIVDKENLKSFLQGAFERDFSLAWGKIGSQKISGFVPNLIGIDKNLSHNIIRPFLWKINIGISIPGQIFCINKSYFSGKLKNYDTVFDDLTLGLICKKENMPVFFSGLTLGYERPKGNFLELVRQRIRWAKGFSETLRYSKKMDSQKFVVLHGIAYHFLWILFWSLFTLLMCFNMRVVALLFIFLSSLFLANFKLKQVFFALCYIIVFPFIHIIWTIALFNNIKAKP